MHKDRLAPAVALFVLILILGGSYYFYKQYAQAPSATDGWLPPESNPPTKQMGVSIEVPEGWRGPTQSPAENPEIAPQ